LTDMNVPLGRAAGNWLEVKEGVACLENLLPRPTQPGEGWGEGTVQLQTTSSPRPSPPFWGGEGEISDLRELVIQCAAHLLLQTKKSKSLATARKLAEDCLRSGAPRRKWDEMLVAQGADLKTFNRKLALDATAKVVAEVKAETAGYVAKCDARVIGEVIHDLGGGRLRKDSKINHDVGVDQIAKPGERVDKSGTLCRVHAAGSVQAITAVARLKTAFEISTKRPAKNPLVVEVIP